MPDAMSMVVRAEYEAIARQLGCNVVLVGTVSAARTVDFCVGNMPMHRMGCPINDIDEEFEPLVLGSDHSGVVGA